MPESYKKERPYPGAYRKLSDAAEAGQIITVKCRNCRRQITFLASDLVRILDPLRDVDEPPFACSKCGSEDLRVEVTSPTEADVGLIDVRRPAGVERRQLWRTVKLGDPLPQLPVLHYRRPMHYAVPDDAKAAIQLAQNFKGWLLELIGLRRAENERLQQRLELRLGWQDNHWVDERDAAMAANDSMIRRIETLVLELDEFGK